MSEWQAIETAPKNGTPILLWLAKPIHSNDVAGYAPWKEIQAVIGWWENEWKIVFMLEGAGDSYGYTSHFFMEVVAPTHWMPLPEHPLKRSE